MGSRGGGVLALRRGGLAFARGVEKSAVVNPDVETAKKALIAEGNLAKSFDAQAKAKDDYEPLSRALRGALRGEAAISRTLGARLIEEPTATPSRTRGCDRRAAS